MQFISMSERTLQECTPENCYEQIARAIIDQADMQLDRRINEQTDFSADGWTLPEIKCLANALRNKISFVNPGELLDLGTVDEWVRAIYRRIGHEMPLPMIL